MSLFLEVSGNALGASDVAVNAFCAWVSGASISARFNWLSSAGKISKVVSVSG